MPKAKPFAKSKENGIYLTDSLNQNDFLKVFKQIEADQASNRGFAKNTLKPALLSRKSIQDLVKIGKRKDGQPFTIDDLKRFDQMRKKFKSRRGNGKGIFYIELIGLANDRRIKRASNRMGDGRDIKSAQFIKLERSIVVNFRVRASFKSKHTEHKVKLRFDSWNDAMMDSDGEHFEPAVKSAMKGNFSIDCSCGDHQYRYRYMATIGGYNLGKSEGAYPKKTNKRLEGTACKHVLLCVQQLQSALFQSRLAIQMRKQAVDVGFLNHNKGAQKSFSEKELKKMDKNRSTNITDRQVEQAKAQFTKYQERQEAMQSLMKGKRGEKLIKQRQELKRFKKKAEQATKKADKLRTQVEKLRDQRANDIKSAVRKQANSAIEVAMGFGATKEQAITAFAKQSGISEKAIKVAIK